PIQAEVQIIDDFTAEVTLLNSEGSVAPGQACVIYNGERVLGGGYIARN
ncbi:MAG: aminomethyltransferase beta-barrel domain-containing protein, partial [Pseudomonadota bacterium]